MIVYLKRFVMNRVSMPVYVNVAHFCLVWCFHVILVGRVTFPGKYLKGVVVYY